MKNNRKRMIGALLSSILFIFIFLIPLCIISYFQLFEEDKMPNLMFILMISYFLIPIIGIAIAFVYRIKEINKGEEDEAKKY